MAGSRRARVALATCAEVPDLDDDDRLVLPELEAAGIDAEPAVWDAAGVDWGAFDAVVVRSTWDYAERRDAFLAWAARLRRVVNALDVLTWNTDKAYLRDLAARGVPIVATQWLTPGDDVEQLLPPDADVVVKPAVSAGSRNTARHARGDAEAVRAHARALLAAGRAVMVQPYVESVDARGETALMFLDGEYSHAVRKAAILRAPGPPTTALFAPEEITPAAPDGGERALAERVLDALPWPRHDLAYARVDVVHDAAGTPALLELELCEPSLFLAHGERSAARLAAAIARRALVGWASTP